MIFGFRRAYSIFSAGHLRNMTISNLFSKRTIIKCSRNKVATNREALHISLFYSPICDNPQQPPLFGGSKRWFGGSKQWFGGSKR